MQVAIMSELYDLPDGWELKKLGDLCNFVRGPFGGSLKKDVFKESGFAVYEQSHAIYDQFENIRYFIDDKKFEEMKRFELKANSLIMSCSGTIGKVAIVPNNIQRGIINQALLMLTPNKGLDSIFLKLLMESNFFQNLLSENSTGAAISNVASVKVLKEIEIPLPSPSEQQRIVSKLDLLFAKIDKSIELHQKNMDEADAFMGSVLNEVFGELEEKYGLIEVGKVTDCIVPQRNKPKQFVGDIPWITTDDLKLFKRISKSTKGFGLTREDIEEVKSKTFPKESVLMSCVGDLGVVAIANAEIVVNQQLHTYQCKDNLLNTFLMYALYVKKDYMYQIANITTVAYMNKAKCNSIPLPLPPLPIQQKVVDYLDSVSEKIEMLKRVQHDKMESLKALKASILDRAFRGEL